LSERGHPWGLIEENYSAEEVAMPSIKEILYRPDRERALLEPTTLDLLRACDSAISVALQAVIFATLTIAFALAVGNRPISSFFDPPLIKFSPTPKRHASAFIEVRI
jgi:hypothetical protein